MNLFNIIGFILIAKSSAIPYMVNCHESNHNIYKDDAATSKLNYALTDISSRTPIFINTETYKCGVKITFNKNSGYINVHHGAIAKKDCDLNNIFCNNYDNQSCKTSVKCCENILHLLGFTCNVKYHLEALDTNSEPYKKNISNCKILDNEKFNCYQIKQLSISDEKHYIEVIPIDTNNNTTQTTNGATQNSLIYFCNYILLVLYSVKQL
jgi:hypothetical protein